MRGRQAVVLVAAGAFAALAAWMFLIGLLADLLNPRTRRRG